MVEMTITLRMILVSAALLVGFAVNCSGSGSGRYTGFRCSAGAPGFSGTGKTCGHKCSAQSALACYAARARASENATNAMPEHIQALVNSISRTHGVDPRLVAAVMKVESNYNRLARSSKGALGLMQLIPATGQRFGVRDFFDPAQNIEGGVRYLKFLSDKFGAHNLDLQLAAYNAGENLVERLGRVPRIQETVDYVRKIKKNLQTRRRRQSQLRPPVLRRQRRRLRLHPRRSPRQSSTAAWMSVA